MKSIYKVTHKGFDPKSVMYIGLILLVCLAQAHVLCFMSSGIRKCVMVLCCQVGVATETLEKQYQAVREETNKSHVMQYGDMVSTCAPVRIF